MVTLEQTGWDNKTSWRNKWDSRIKVAPISSSGDQKDIDASNHHQKHGAHAFFGGGTYPTLDFMLKMLTIPRYLGLTSDTLVYRAAHSVSICQCLFHPGLNNCNLKGQSPLLVIRVFRVFLKWKSKVGIKRTEFFTNLW